MVMVLTYIAQPFTYANLVMGKLRIGGYALGVFIAFINLMMKNWVFPLFFNGRVFLSFERIKSKATDYEFNVLKVISVYKDGHQLQSIFLGQQEIVIEENHPYLFSMLGITERNGKYINVKFYNPNHPLFRIEEPDD